MSLPPKFNSMPPKPKRKSGPPSHQPKDLSQQFAADPFLASMREPGPDGMLTHTDLGLLVEIWHWYATHMISSGPAFEPIAKSVYDHLQRKCPQVVADVRRLSGGELTNQK